MANADLDELNFDELVRLAQEDPEAFEALRTQKIRQLTDAAPARRRLLRLQWQIDI